MRPESFRILLAVDDAYPGVELTRLLGRSGFRVSETVTAGNAVQALSAGSFDLLFLSATDSAAEVCRKARVCSPRTRIIILRRSITLADEIAALADGADDCIMPFRFREAVARIRAVLSRGTESPRVEPDLRAGELMLHSGLKKVSRAGRELRIAPREFDVLEYLMRNEDEALTHARLLHEVWRNYPRANRALVRSAVNALRRKIEANPARPEYIVTEPWVGYRFRNPDMIFRWEKEAIFRLSKQNSLSQD